MVLSYGSSNWARTSDIMINSHALYRLSYGGIYIAKLTAKKRKSRHWYNFPGRRRPSIVYAKELNFCVRNGNRWDLFAINTGYLKMNIKNTRTLKQKEKPSTY